MSEVWGTFAVNDHLRTDAFIREVLVFDRLVVPVPANAKERERWIAPNAKNPTETWNPDRLDALLAVLGTQRNPNGNERPLVWAADWSRERWLSQRQVADTITQVDAFGATRLILAEGEELPDAVEAVAAYPSKKAWRKEISPVAERPEDLGASDALLMLSYPLLVPDVVDQDPLEVLQDAANLGRDPEFREQRDAFYNWLRGYLAPFQRPDQPLGKLQADVGSLELARHRLNGQLDIQAELLKERKRTVRWDRVQTVFVAGAASAACVAAVVAAPPLAAAVGLASGPAALIGAGGGVVGAIAGFGGWVAGRYAQPLPQPRPLNGASMFATAAEILDFELARVPGG